MKYLKMLSILLPILLLGISTTYAETQGSIGSTSSGNSVVSLNIPELVGISGLSDISLSTSNMSTPATGNTTACIYTNSQNSGQYNITATSASDTSSTGTFYASNGSTKLEYTAKWNDGTTDTTLTSGTTLTNQTGANETSINCSGGSNSTLTVTFETADMQAVPAGNYTDTVTLEVAPI